MLNSILSHEPLIRLGFFSVVLLAMMVWEVLAPRRVRVLSRWARWPSNLGLVALNTLLVRLISASSAVGFAAFAESRGWGLFNVLALPHWVSIVAAVIALDFAIYLQHVMFHAVPALWRLHRMHHADQDLDVTSGARFHPAEILLSLGFKIIVIAASGAPPVAVIIFEVLLNATSMFNHGNVRMPVELDQVLRRFVVTPDMHRVHHSIIRNETNSNFGFSLPWWDRLLGTYQAQPAKGHESMTIGLDVFRAPKDQRLDRMLSQPFVGADGSYPINRRGPSS